MSLVMLIGDFDLAQRHLVCLVLQLPKFCSVFLREDLLQRANVLAGFEVDPPTLT